MSRWNKNYEASNPKKQQPYGVSINETLRRSNFSTPGTQCHRKYSDDVTQRMEGGTRNAILKKRIRTSVAELKAEGRGSTSGRSAMFMGKDVLNDNVDDSGFVEEKIRKLPAGGDGWDRKIKRKRSAGTVLARSSQAEGGARRILHHKQPPLEASGGQACRSGSSLGNGGLKLAGNILPRSSARVLPKSETEKVSVSKNLTPGFSEEKLIAKGSKPNVHEDYQIMNASSSTKLKGRRNGHVMAANPSSNSPWSSVALEGREPPPHANKPQSVSDVNHHKGLFPTGLSSSMAQWVGQRPQKKSRIRRINLVSPVSNQDELQMSLEGRSAAELGSNLTSAGTSSPSLDKGVTYSPPKLKIKIENVPSPARLSDSEEYKAGEDREIGFQEKQRAKGEMEEMCANSAQTASPSQTHTRRKRILNKADSVDGVPRQGRSSRASSFSRITTSAIQEKLDSPSSTMPFRSPKPAPDKNKSKSGRSAVKKPLKRKVDRVQQTSFGDELDFIGELDDDWEELLAAAKFARSASYLGCSSPFFKKMENVFASLGLEDMYYLKQQLLSPAELRESKSQTVISDPCCLDCPSKNEYSLSGSLLSSDGDQKQQDQKELNEFTSLVDQSPDATYCCRRADSVRGNEVTPLYQMLLSALIAEDEMEECEYSSAGSNTSLQDYSDSSPCGASSSAMDGYHCNGSTSSIRGSNIQHQSHDYKISQEHNGLMDSHASFLPETLENGVDGSVSGQNSAASGIILHDCEYGDMGLEERLLLELQSLDLCPENVPELADREDETINQEIIKLQNELNQQAGKKTPYLNKIIEEVQKWRGLEEGALEQIALDRLVESAFRKKLATNGKIAARLGLTKVSREHSAGFTKRTLARCRKYKNTNRSDFTESALRDVLLAAPPRIDDADNMDCFGSRKSEISEEDFAKTGPILNKGKPKEVLLDNVGGKISLEGAPNFQKSLLNGAKGKRSAREKGKYATRNCVTKAGRNGRKAKSKPKHKSAQMPNVDCGLVGNTETTHPVYKLGSVCNNATNSIRDVNEPLEGPNTEPHPIGDLDVANGLGENDVDNILNFDEECLQDGLEDWSSMELGIPMDDLAGLGMIFN